MTTDIGIIGCGRAATSLHLPALRRVAGVRVVALADTDAGRLAAAKEEVPGAAAYSDGRDLFAHPDLSAVLVATPPRTHAALVEEALEKGLHVLVEKPLAASPQEAAALVARAATSGVRAAVGHNLRCHRLVCEARDRLAEGWVGNPEVVRTIWTSDIGIGDIGLEVGLSEWSSRRAELGGVVHEIGIHHFDLMRFLLDRDIEEVHTVSRGEDRVCSISGRLSGDLPFNMAFSRSTSAQHQIEVWGSEGSLTLDCYRFDGIAFTPTRQIAASPGARLRRFAQTAIRLPEGVRVSRRGGHYIDSFRLEWESLLGAIRDGSPVHCSFEDGRRAVEVAHASVRSSVAGRPVRVERATGLGGGLSRAAPK